MPITNSDPIAPGAVVMNEIVPSGFLRLPTSLFHSPKSKIVEAPEDHFEEFAAAIGYH